MANFFDPNGDNDPEEIARRRDVILADALQNRKQQMADEMTTYSDEPAPGVAGMNYKETPENVRRREMTMAGLTPEQVSPYLPTLYPTVEGGRKEAPSPVAQVPTENEIDQYRPTSPERNIRPVGIGARNDYYNIAAPLSGIIGSLGSGKAYDTSRVEAARQNELEQDAQRYSRDVNEANSAEAKQRFMDENDPLSPLSKQMQERVNSAISILPNVSDEVKQQMVESVGKQSYRVLKDNDLFNKMLLIPQKPGKPLTGTGTPKLKETNEERSALSRLERMKEADAELNMLISKGWRPSLLPAVAAGLPVIGAGLASPEQRAYERLANTFAGAVLRDESGAAISVPEEMKDYTKYIPQRGDSDEELARKAKFRATIMRGMVTRAGNAFENMYQKKPTDKNALEYMYSQGQGTTVPTGTVVYNANPKDVQAAAVGGEQAKKQDAKNGKTVDQAAKGL